MQELIRFKPGDIETVVRRFLAGRKPSTLRAYRASLEDFARSIGAESPLRAVEILLGVGHGRANALAQEYADGLVAGGAAPATVKLRVAALRSVVKLARTFGLVVWELEVRSPKVERFLDTRGPGTDGVRRLLEAAEKGRGLLAARDRALVRLLYDLALRRGEVVALELSDLDLEAGRVAVLGKGKSAKTELTLPDRTREALAAWVEVRGNIEGPLFASFDRARKGSGRLTGRSVARILEKLGKEAGLSRRVRPHGLRHAAITAALDATGGDLRRAARFSRHADLRTLGFYDDNRQDLGGEVAALVAGGI